jgi:hypothetical protein
METKTCTKCGEAKPLDRFSEFVTRTGNRSRRGSCRWCRDASKRARAEELKEYRKNYNAKNRSRKRERDHKRRVESKAYVDGIKATTPCTDCGKKFPPVCMDFDHVRGVKSKGVASLVGSSYKLDLIKEEIAKCEIVCACCHRLRTEARKQNRAPPKTPA